MIARIDRTAKAFLALLLLFFIGLGCQSIPTVGGERSKNIPGIDPLPAAVQQDRSLPTSTQTTSTIADHSATVNPQVNPQMNPADPGFPKVRNLTVVTEPSEPYTAKLSWDLYPDASTPLYVVRYSKPISNRTLLLEAYNLTSPPLSAGTQVFLNRDMPEGVYYYAVVTAFELSRDGRLELRAGQNYTILPFMVYRSDKGGPADQNLATTTHANRDANLKPDDFYIKQLSAMATERGAVLNWTALPLKGIEYQVYRSVEPLDSKERLERAVKIGTAREDSPFITDANPLEGKRVFYGVTVKDLTNGSEYQDLKYDISYTDFTFRRPQMEVRYDAFLPESLTAYLTSADSIQLIWVDPGPSVTKYRVFRNTVPITTAEILGASKDLGVVMPNSGGFRDANLPAATYYYALLPVTTSGEMLSVLQAGRTFTMFGISLRGVYKEEDTLSNLADKADKTTEDSTKVVDRSQTRQNDSDVVENGVVSSAIRSVEVRTIGHDVEVSWKISQDRPKTKLKVYRSQTLIADSALLSRRAELVDDVPVTEGFVIDRNVGAGPHYYTVAEYDPKTQTYVRVYFVKEPVILNTSADDVVSDHEGQLDKILSGPFTMGRFSETENQLSAYLDRKDISQEDMSKALFYLGIVKFRLQKFADAAHIFENPIARAHDGERARFWYRISRERMSK